MQLSIRSFLLALALFPLSAVGGISITSFPYLNSFESQADVIEATHVASECIGQISHLPTGGWNNTGAFKMRIVDHPSPSCPKEEDTAGIGTYNWPALGGQSQINLGMLIYFGSNFTQPIASDDGAKWILLRASNGERPMLALRHYGGGDPFKLFQACQGAGGGGCQDEFGCMFPSDCGNPPSAYSFRIDERHDEWIWMEWEVVVGGENTIYVFTQDGALSGYYASTPSGLVSGTTIDAFNEMSYWEGAQNTTADTYILMDELTISNSFIGPPSGFLGGSDTDPPSVSNPTPTGELPSTTTSTTLGVMATDPSGVTGCRWDSSDVAYASMGNTFSAIGGSAYEGSQGGLSSGNSYTYYVRCIDAESNANSSSTVISFSVAAAADVTPPELSNLLPSGQLADDANPQQLEVDTNEVANCRYGRQGQTWGQMSPMSVTGGTNHNQDIIIRKNTNYRYDIRCQDLSGNESLGIIYFQTRGPSTGRPGGFLGMLDLGL